MSARFPARVAFGIRPRYNTTESASRLTHETDATVKPRLSIRTFYATIVAGVCLGAVVAGGAAWAYLRYGEARPNGRQIWNDVADEFVVPVAVMMGGTFGGLAGVAAAVLLDRRGRTDTSDAPAKSPPVSQS